MPLPEFFKQFDEPTLKALSIAFSALGVGAKLFTSARASLNERAGDHRRAKCLQQVRDLAATLAHLDSVSVVLQPEVVQVRASILREIGLLNARIAQTYPVLPDLTPLTVPHRTDWQRRFLLYWPQRKLAWVPQLIFYYFCFVLLVLPLAATELGVAQVTVVWLFFALFTLGIRYWAAITEYTGRPVFRPLWQRLTLFYRPFRARGFIAHLAYWFFAFTLVVGTLSEVIEKSAFDRDTLAGVLGCLLFLIACQQWARAYDAPPALILPADPVPSPLTAHAAAGS